MTHYRVASTTRSFGPSRTFTRLKDALAYAEEAAKRFHLDYAVWRIESWRFRFIHCFGGSSVKSR
jgi:hypothetical protein